MSTCKPWIPGPPIGVVPTLINPAAHEIEDDFPDFSFGMKCRY
ncbi:hypothetical protein [Polynucleobacter asymbioticus]|nr:hypothetical protein [Polynucleobacter asymbioticus]